MKLLLLAALIQNGQAYSMYDLNNNDKTWEFSGKLILSSHNGILANIAGISQNQS